MEQTSSEKMVAGSECKGTIPCVRQTDLLFTPKFEMTIQEAGRPTGLIGLLDGHLLCYHNKSAIAALRRLKPSRKCIQFIHPNRNSTSFLERRLFGKNSPALTIMTWCFNSTSRMDSNLHGRN